MRGAGWGPGEGEGDIDIRDETVELADGLRGRDDGSGGGVERGGGGIASNESDFSGFRTSHLREVDVEAASWGERERR